MTVERYVIDTNVLISAALSAHSAPGVVVRRILAQGEVLFSEATFAELQTRMWRPKFDRYLTLESRKLILHDFRAVARWADIPPAVSTRRFCRDADDDKFLHLALAGAARVIVSGDKDLLDLGQVDTVQILSPAMALARMG
ncbi:MAG: putative toxin-antitoxin system toxin component, PIN family [Rhodoferax sp.]|nr:putative toxin-antitoxin system toxin component, PIN family [Rhodoferax sp.]